MRHPLSQLPHERSRNNSRPLHMTRCLTASLESYAPHSLCCTTPRYAMLPVFVPRLPLCNLRCSPTKRVLGLIIHNHARHDTPLLLTCLFSLLTSLFPRSLTAWYTVPVISTSLALYKLTSRNRTRCYSWLEPRLLQCDCTEVHTYRITTRPCHACLSTPPCSAHS